MIEDLLCGLDAGFAHGGDHIGHAQLTLDFAIPKLHSVLCHLLARWVRPKDRGVTRGKNIDGVRGHGGHGMGDGKHHADDAPRSALDDAQARAIATRIASHGFHSKHEAHVGELQNLVIEAADLGLLHFHAAQLLAAVVADTTYDVYHSLALIEAHGRDSYLCLKCCIRSLVHGGEHTVVSPGPA